MNILKMVLYSAKMVLVWFQACNNRRSLFAAIYKPIQHILHQSEEHFHHARIHLSMKWIYAEPLPLMKNPWRAICFQSVECGICHAAKNTVKPHLQSSSLPNAQFKLFQVFSWYSQVKYFWFCRLTFPLNYVPSTLWEKIILHRTSLLFHDWVSIPG